MVLTFDDVPVKQQHARYFGPAKVLDLNNEGTKALLGFERGDEKIETWGKIMLSLSHNLTFGDIVLAAGEDINEIYVIGVMSSGHSGKKKISTSSGAYALIEKNEDSEKLQLFSGRDELIFEYEPSSGTCRVNIETGNMEFITKKGNINFNSEGNINFKSRQSVNIEAVNGIRISVRNLYDQIQSSILLDKIKMKLSSPNLHIISAKADFRISAAKYIGSSFSAVLKETKLIAGRYESIMGDIISRAKNVYKTVDELTQLKTGRLRMLVKSTLHLKSKNSYLNAEEDFKINAEKIHLG